MMRAPRPPRPVVHALASLASLAALLAAPAARGQDAPPLPAPAPPPPPVVVPPTPAPLPPAPAPAAGAEASAEPLRPWPVAAPADGEDAAKAPAGPLALPRLRIGAGLKFGYYGDPTLDAFADSDVITSWSMDATYTLFASRPFSVAAGVGWDVGGRSTGARGLKTSLATHRFEAPIEARYHALPFLYGFARVAPGAAMHLARVEDVSAPAALKDTAWAFSAEGSLGVNALVAPYGAWDKKGPRVWVAPEIGYAWTTAASLHLHPDRDAEDAVGTDASANLGSLALRGLFWRASLAVSF